MKVGAFVGFLSWLSLALLARTASAQTPASIAGDGFLIYATSGAYPFASYGYYLFIPSNSGNQYQAIDIYNIKGSTGSYTYAVAGSSQAVVGINDSLAGAGTVNVSFESENSGSFRSTANSYPGGYQAGDFNFVSFNAPPSIAGKTFVCTIDDGLYPFDGNGTFTLTVAGSGNVYAVSDGSAGTYSYSLLNRSTAVFQANDSQLGSFTVYFGFTGSSNGGFAIRQASTGGFQVGDFYLLDTIPPALSVTTPAPNAQTTNSSYIISGSAHDNVAVSNVVYSLNGSPWTSCVTSNNWTNWNAVVAPSPGTNWLQVYAVDTSGNLSATNAVRFVEVDKVALYVGIAGGGAVSPNYNGQSLQVGENYSMTANAAAGFVFSNWIQLQVFSEVTTTHNGPPGSTPTITYGSVLYTLPVGVATNRPTLTFAMAAPVAATSPSNNPYISSIIGYQANFMDVQKPVLTISSPSPNQFVNTNAFTIHGTAGDNAAVSNVWCNFNGGGWQLATGTNSWSVPVTLNPGTNTVMAYAVDTSGNISTTNVVRFVYVDKTVLTVATVGGGSVAPNYNGQSLQVGENYTVTATPGKGFAFTNWITPARAVLDPGAGPLSDFLPGIILTNKPTLVFEMSSNLTLVANFVDIAPPSVVVTTPAVASVQVSNSFYLAAGRAADNVGVTNVYYNLNHAGWLSTISTNGWTNWTAQLNLASGTNVLQAYAVDAAGNQSATNSVSLNYIVSAQLTVITNQPGWGRITPALNNAWLAVNKNYTLTAAAGPGIQFVNWTNNFGLVTNSPAVTFQMQSNLAMTATFVDTQKPSLTISSPTPNQFENTNAITIRGTASDNVAVSNVWYNLDDGGWQPASGTNNWSAPVGLNPGTNTLMAYAVDTSGNVSATNTVNFVCVDKAVLSLAISGGGSVTPNYNGQSLQLGQNYTMTAVPVAGFAFTNWTEVWISLPYNRPVPNPQEESKVIATAEPPPGVSETDVTNVTILTNNPTLTFAMSYDYVNPPVTVVVLGEVISRALEANFIDVAPPTVTVTSPAANSSVSNTVYTVTGRAVDNVGVAGVYYQINDSGWQPASTGNGYTNWLTSSLSLVEHTNIFQFYGVDTSGNISPTNTIRFVNLQPDPAPDSLAGLQADFGGFFMQFGADSYVYDPPYPYMPPPAIGHYTYAKYSPTNALLVYSNTEPPFAVGPAETVELTFSSLDSGVYSNEVSGDSGTVSLVAVSSAVPASVAGKKLLLIDQYGPVTAVSFGTRTMSYTNSSVTDVAAACTFEGFSPQVALITAGGVARGTNYWMLNYNNTNYGSYYGLSYDALGNCLATNTGEFVFPSAAPISPASLNGISAEQIFSGYWAYVNFGQGSFDMLLPQGSGVGSYSYAKLGGNQGVLIYTGPQPKYTYLLNFVASDFCLVDQDTNAGTSSAMWFLPVTSGFPRPY